MKKSFTSKIYQLARKIPRGKVTTYKELAKAINSRAYRAVGTAMKKNPCAPKIPCHRVVKNNGEVGRFAKGTKKKIELLRKEGVEVRGGKVDLKKYFFTFK